MKTNDSTDKSLERLHNEITVLHQRIKRLEEENAAFAGMLKEKGVEVQSISKISFELPPPETQPLAKDDEAFSLMSDDERGLMENVTDGKPVFVVVRSETQVDTGSWIKKSPVWTGTTDSEVFMFAAGKKPVIDRISFSQLQKSIFNHVTGCLILAPAAELKISSLAMAPLDGYQLLAQIYNEGESK